MSKKETKQPPVAIEEKTKQPPVTIEDLTVKETQGEKIKGAGPVTAGYDMQKNIKI